ncbi:MAG: SUMF1/EgtB/PvdO family nonheme iron enzyme [Planctomycetota bacterium]|nr:SUMF1/EgtB/PvdO family nonheme iron enzyme [Planctomycetota bacterium]
MLTPNRVPLVTLLALAVIPPLGAAELTGQVESVTGATITIRIEADSRPNPGDRVEVFFEIPGLNELAKVATGTVTAVRGKSVEAKIEKSTSKVAARQLVKVFATPSGSDTLPSVPATGADGKSITNSIGMQLTLVPAGEFLMGAPEHENETTNYERPQHRVRITKAFYLGVHEVTQAEFERLRGTNPSKFKPVAGQDAGRLPVEQVSWDDAGDFCRKLSRLPAETAAGRVYCLPTEAQWEYACRAGTTTPFNLGLSLNGTDANINGSFPYGTEQKGPNLQRTTTVGSYRPNAFGLYDMHGNVREWCADWCVAGYDATSPVSDPSGPSSGSYRVVRGGSWLNAAKYCRSASRTGHKPKDRLNYMGFRVCFVPAKD